MKLVIQPRVQVETWSLYWKESMKTDTLCLEALTVEVGPAMTVQQLMEVAADKVGWQSEDKLLRLEGFKDPWQRALCAGRHLLPQAALADVDMSDGSVVTLVRVELVAEGWKVSC